jgi:hypothetical protein
MHGFELGASSDLMLVEPFIITLEKGDSWLNLTQKTANLLLLFISYRVLIWL